MDCRPNALAMLRERANRKLKWSVAIPELVDNAIDANSKMVAIEVSKKAFFIEDDGDGALRLADFYTIGGRTDHRTTRSGRYGVGSKDATLWIGGEESKLAIESVRNGRMRSTDIKWSQLAKANWQALDPSERTAEPGEIGTQLRISPVKRSLPRGDAWQNLLDTLGYIYSPAIKRGCAITIRRRGIDKSPVLVDRWKLPKLTNVIDTTIVVAGKTARVHAGLLPDGVRERRWGITYMHGFRVIVASSSKGCGTFSASKVCGFVELKDEDGNNWKLTTNKDDIAEDAELLFEAVETALLPLLQKAEVASESLESAAFEAAISETINAILDRPNSKAKRGALTGRKGSVRPTGKGGKHKRARNEQPGDTFRSASGRGCVRVSYQYLGDSAGYGDLKAPNVVLNRDNAFVERINRSRNRDAAVAMVMGLVGVDWLAIDDSPQLKLRGMSPHSGDHLRDFSGAVGNLLEQVSDEQPESETDAAQ